MKIQKMKLLAGIAASGILLFCINTGCKKSSNSGSSGGAVSATVGGTAYQSQFETGLYSASAGMIEISGDKFAAGDTTALVVVVPNTIQLNQAMTFAAGTTVGYTDSKSGAAFGGNAGFGYGSVTVTAWDSTRHTISGTFSGVLQSVSNSDTLAISNGHFSGSYSVTP